MGGWLSGAIAAAVVGMTLGGCGAAADFTCQSDVQCMAAGPGVCQPDGYCSFPADDCPSGQRYGEHSGSRSGQCVDAGGDDVGGTHGEGSTSTSGVTGEATTPVLTSSEPTTADATTGEPVTASSDGGSGETASDDATTGEPVDPDLVLWLELERALVGEVLDSSSFLSHGECVPPTCPEAAVGVLGQGVHLDGIDDAIVVPHGPQLETLDGLTVAVWIRLDEPPVGHRAVLTKPVGAGIDDSWELYFSSSSQVLRFAISTGGVDYDVQLSEVFPVAQWVHLAGTWDAGVMTLWVDGAEIASLDAPVMEFDDHPVLVGADDDHDGGLSGHFLGGIDDVRVYRRALAADEIATLASTTD